MGISKQARAALQRFGKDILETENVLRVDDPEIVFSVDDLFGMFPESGKSKEMQVGVCNALWSAIDANFAKLNPKQVEELKTGLINLVTPGLDGKSVDALADAIISLYRRLNNKWPELVDFVLKTKPKAPIVAALFVRFMATTNSAFQKQNFGNIVAVIDELIENASVQVQTALVVLIGGLGERVFEKEGLFDKMWTALINVVTVDPSRAAKLYVPLDMIYGSSAGIADLVPQKLNLLLCSIEKDWKPALPLLKLIPYLPVGPIRDLLSSCGDWSAQGRALGSCPVHL